MEINNEIKLIEGENKGHLREQAYQALIRWHCHNGRKASLSALKQALRDIQENRLADHVEMQAEP